MISLNSELCFVLQVLQPLFPSETFELPGKKNAGGTVRLILQYKINLWRLTSWLYGPILPSCETTVVTVVPPVEFVGIVEF